MRIRPPLRPLKPALTHRWQRGASGQRRLTNGWDEPRFPFFADLRVDTDSNERYRSSIGASDGLAATMASARSNAADAVGKAITRGIVDDTEHCPAMITADFSGQVLVAVDQVGVAFSRLILDPAGTLMLVLQPCHEGRNARRRCNFRLPRRLGRREWSLLLSPHARIDQLWAKLANRDSRPMANVYPVAIH